MAAVIVAGTDGLRRRLALGEPVHGNPYELGEERLGPPLPATLDGALDALAADTVLWDALGGELCETYVQVKRYELGRWHAELARVTEWERDEYATTSEALAAATRLARLHMPAAHEVCADRPAARDPLGHVRRRRAASARARAGRAAGRLAGDAAGGAGTAGGLGLPAAHTRGRRRRLRRRARCGRVARAAARAPGRARPPGGVPGGGRGWGGRPGRAAGRRRRAGRAARRAGRAGAATMRACSGGPTPPST